MGDTFTEVVGDGFEDLGLCGVGPVGGEMVLLLGEGGGDVLDDGAEVEDVDGWNVVGAWGEDGEPGGGGEDGGAEVGVEGGLAAAVDDALGDDVASD